MNPSSREQADEVIPVTIVESAGKKLWNYTEASEPLSKNDRPSRDMLSPSAKTRYAVLIAVMVIGAMMFGPTASIRELVGAIGFGWALGQFLSWSAPR